MGNATTSEGEQQIFCFVFSFGWRKKREYFYYVRALCGSSLGNWQRQPRKRIKNVSLEGRSCCCFSLANEQLQGGGYVVGCSSHTGSGRQVDTHTHFALQALLWSREQRATQYTWRASERAKPMTGGRVGAAWWKKLAAKLAFPTSRFFLYFSFAFRVASLHRGVVSIKRPRASKRRH